MCNFLILNVHARVVSMYPLPKREHGTSYVIIDVRLNKRPFNTKCRC